MVFTGRRCGPTLGGRAVAQMVQVGASIEACEFVSWDGAGDGPVERPKVAKQGRAAGSTAPRLPDVGPRAACAASHDAVGRRARWAARVPENMTNTEQDR